jgi:hypothetical protein
VVVSHAPIPAGRLSLPSDFDGVELHAHCKYGLVLTILEFGVGPDNGAVIEVVHLLVVGHDKLAPLLFARLALHLLLVDCGFRVEIGKVLLEVFVDLIVELGQPQLGAGYFLEDLPVCLDVLYNCRRLLDVEGHGLRHSTFDGKCLLDLHHG